MPLHSLLSILSEVLSSKTGLGLPVRSIAPWTAHCVAVAAEL
jgi:hypothetical protein